jgi:phosphoenolpyruvate carboxykinase (GTP)
VDVNEWRSEVPQIEAWFDQIGSDKVPVMLWTELDALKARLPTSSSP